MTRRLDLTATLTTTGTVTPPIGPVPPDTAAALEAAIGAHKHDIIDHAALHHAITAHVETEVARRLAAAPGVEAAIVDYAHAAQSDFDTHEERDALRAAIAADKARAVGEALLRQWAAIEVASQTDADLGALAKDGVMACPTCDHERLPREDAERLIDAFALASSTRQKRAARNHDGRDDWDRETTARTALLRALGVEA